jgi:ferritin-like metal-binding protein YciE
MEDTPKGECTDAGIIAAMRAAAKAKVASYREKVTAVANPKLGDKFLDEVIF